MMNHKDFDEFERQRQDLDLEKTVNARNASNLFWIFGGLFLGILFYAWVLSHFHK